MNRVVLNAFFPGEPVTWKRAGGHGRRRFNPKFMENAKKKLRRQLRMILPKLKPDTLSRFGFQACFSTAHRGDGDNFEKLVLDAFKGVIWQDDEQVDEGQWSKVYRTPVSGHLGILLIVYKIG